MTSSHGRVGQEYCEDTSDLFATNRARRARGIWRTTWHTDKWTALYIAAYRRPTNQITAWQAERGNRSTRATSSALRVCRACQRGCHEDATRMLYEETASMEFKLYSAVSHTRIKRRKTTLCELSSHISWRKRTDKVSANDLCVCSSVTS